MKLTDQFNIFYSGLKTHQYSIKDSAPEWFKEVSFKLLFSHEMSHGNQRSDCITRILYCVSEGIDNGIVCDDLSLKGYLNNLKINYQYIDYIGSDFAKNIETDVCSSGNYHSVADICYEIENRIVYEIGDRLFTSYQTNILNK